MEQIILGQVEISDQMLDKDDMWLSKEAWEPRIKYITEMIGILLGQAERGINVVAQIQTYLKDMDEILAKVPPDQLSSAHEYISESLPAEGKKASIFANILLKRAGDEAKMSKAPLKELNQIMKQRDKDKVNQQKDEMHRIHEPERQTVQTDVNVGERAHGASLKSRTITAATKFFEGQKVQPIGGIHKDETGMVKEVHESLHTARPEVTYKVRFTTKSQFGYDDFEYSWYNENELKEAEVARIGFQPVSAGTDMDKVAADLSAGFDLLMAEIEKSTNPYVVSELGKKLYKREQAEDKIVREGKVSR
jgi:hypothetical protein